MEFVKMEGLGNDFVVVDGPAEVGPDEVRRWCDRRLGIGADGVLEITSLATDRVRMRYWNADGGAAEMCGNGLRCVALLAHLRGWVDQPDFIVATAVGDRPVHVGDDGMVRALLGTASTTDDTPIAAHGLDLYRVDVGNPHAVTIVDDTRSAPVTELGPRIEVDERFPEGTNVEFAAVTGPDRIALRVWERGVGETQACGTGAAATAFVGHHLGLTGRRVTVDLLGGPLVVDIEEAGDAWIEGPARAVFTGTVD